MLPRRRVRCQTITPRVPCPVRSEKPRLRFRFGFGSNEARRFPAEVGLFVYQESVNAGLNDRSSEERFNFERLQPGDLRMSHVTRDMRQRPRLPRLPVSNYDGRDGWQELVVIRSGPLTSSID